MGEQYLAFQKSLREVLNRPETCAVNDIVWVNYLPDGRYRVGTIGRARGKLYGTWDALLIHMDHNRFPVETGWNEAPYREKRNGRVAPAKRGIPYQIREAVDAEDGRGAAIFKLVKGERGLYSVIYHSFTGNEHFYYVCDRMTVLAVCNYQELAFALHAYLESGTSLEKFQELLGS